MKTNLMIFIFLLSVFLAINIYPQADYSDPKDVAGKFLQLCLEGKRFVACQLYGTDGCQDQISYLLQRMIMNNIPLKNELCKYSIDSCQLDEAGNSAKCFYSKVCKNAKKNKKGFLTMIKVDDKWLVEYLYKRDKFL